MRAAAWVRMAIGAACVVVGGVWIGQGVGWIDGSFMSGEAAWAVIGVAVFTVGVLLLAGVVRGRGAP